jgi:hypothetical protein
VSSGLPYGHMGATLTDAVLQSGISYETVVLPRVERILRDYPGRNPDWERFVFSVF